MRRIVYGFHHLSSDKRTRLAALIGALLVLAGHVPGRVSVLAQGGGCATPANGVVAENCRAGDTDWDLVGGNDPAIQGYATDISVNSGQTVTFKVRTDATAFRLDIYRLGYYGGAGARKIATQTVAGPKVQLDCLEDTATGLIDCGNWTPSATWNSAGAVSGIYVAKLTRTDGVFGSGSGQSHMIFVVRDDARHSDLLFQTSDTTWQAYNRSRGDLLGVSGNSLYFGGPGSNPGRAYKVSYNRPFDTRDHDPQSWLFNSEYPMVRWLESNGYDVSYFTGVDSERNGALIKNHKAFLSVGHDEYWSAGQRTNVESARDAGTHLAFFSGNEVFWKTRWESSIDGAGTAFRTLVSYKETFSGAKIDPNAAWTGSWRDPRLSPPADGGKPENGLTGTIFTVNCCTYAITVPAEMGAHRFWRNTDVATLAPGQTQTLAQNTLGYEWDEDLDNGVRPAGLTRLSATTVSVPEKLVDFGTTYAPGVATHALTLYRRNTVDGLGTPHTALVFGAGTVQWSWGLDGIHDRGGSTPDRNMQQATVNLLADMTVQPGSLQPDLTPTSASTDSDAPTSSISSPVSGATVGSGDRVTISGTAVDTGGTVAGVEVSVDGGATWHAAKGTSSWTYDWFPNALGPVTLTSRATDDSGNVGAPSDGVPVTVGAGRCPCSSLWNQDTTVPTVADSADDTGVEVGVKFTSDVDGFITGLRFYKALGNTGTHIGNLWTSSGTLLRSATFTGESAAGWQRVTFGAPVPVMANTTYVASYHTNVGHYSADRDYFATMGVNAPPLHAPPGNNGVFRYGVSAFPNQSFRDTNYWVDVDFSTAIIDVTLTISGITSTAIDGSNAIISWTTNDDADSRVDYSTSASLPPAQTVSVTNSALVRQHSMHLTGLTPNATYFARLTSTGRTGDSAVALAPGFTVPGPTLHDTASIDFLAGTQGATCDVNGQNCVDTTYVSETGDGELILAPTAHAEFSGTALPPGWIGQLWQPSIGGSFEVTGGNLLVDGARVGTCDLAAVPDCESGIYGPGHSLEFVATFSGDPFQHAGFGIRFEDQTPRAVFSTDAGGALKARTYSDSGTVISTSLGTLLLGTPHRYRIDWNPLNVDFSVDGILVASHVVTITGPMRPVAASDYNPLGGNVVVDWIRMDPYAASGSFLSRVFDATAAVDWKTVAWTDTRPAGTSLIISVRTGNTAVPDATWGAFVPLPGPGPITAHARYIQYRADLATSDLRKTPELSDIIVTTAAAPVAVDDAATTAVNTSVLFRATGPTSLTINDTDADTPVNQLRVIAVSTPSHGTAALGANRTVTYTPFTNFTGLDTFTYTITDGLLTATGTVRVTVGGNQPPVSSGGSATTAEDTAVSVALVASDANGDPLTYIIVTPPAHGTLSGTAPNLTYTPALNYNGPDSFTWKVSDGTSESAVSTESITVNPVNDAPVADGQSVTTAEDTAKAITLTASDVDSSALVYSVVTGPAHGSLSGTAPFLTYTPALNYNGPDSFTFKANDLSLDSSPATISITVTPVNDAPVANAQAVTTAEDTAKAIALTASDVDSPTLTYSVVTGPAHGSLSGTAPNLTYTPALNYNGPDSFTFKANDGSLDSTAATVSITVTPVNDAPVANAQSVTTAEDTAKAIVLTASDVDSPTLTYSVVTNPAHGTLSGTAPNVTYTPALNYNGPDSFTFKANDGSLDSAAVTVSITVTAVNDAPVANAQSVTTAEDTAKAIVLTASDVDSPTLTYSVVTNPAHGTLSGTAPNLTYTPALNYNGPDSFTFKANDGSLDSAAVTVSITVTAVNDAPVANAQSVTTAEDTAKAIVLTASDVDSPTLTYSVVTNPAHGTLSGTAPNLTYTPALNYNGPDSFTFKANDGSLDSAAVTVSITVTAVNDAPVANAQAVTTNEDVAKAIVLTASDVDSPTLTYSVVTNPAHGTLSGTAPNLTYTPTAAYNGADSFTFKASDGTLSSANATVSITVTAVNDAPGFTKGPDVTVAVSSPAQTVANWATNISAGPADEAGQALNFIVSNNNTALFSVQPAISATGTLTFTPAANQSGQATVTVQVHDNGGVANGGVDTSAAQTFKITLSLAPTTTSVTSSSNPALDNAPVTFTATVAPVAPFTGVPTGTVLFKDGGTSLGSIALIGGKATLTTAALNTGTHSITGVYGGSSGYTTSTSPALSQVIAASGTAQVDFIVYAIQDNSSRPAVRAIPVPNAQVKIFAMGTPCAGPLLGLLDPKKWSQIYETCQPLTFGSYQATGTTDAAGRTNIVVPPLASNPTTQYVVIGKATNFDYVGTATSPDPLYSAFPILAVAAGQTVRVPLPLLATFNGKIVPGSQIELFGTYLNVIQPAYYDWTEDREQYPVVMVAEGDWDVSTELALPSGFVPDATQIETNAVDTTTAVQFTVDDVGSDFTTATMTNVVRHKGKTTVSTTTMPMFNKKRTKAKPDYAGVLPNSAATTIDVLSNDNVAPPKTLTITAVTQGSNGTVALSVDGKAVTYAPNPDFGGTDTFTYTIDDGAGGVSTGTVQVRVSTKPSLIVSDALVSEGDTGTKPAVFLVTLSSPVSVPVIFDYATLDGSAVAGVDYAYASGTVVIPPGQTSMPIAVQVIGNTAYQYTRNFSVKLSNVINKTAVIQGGTGAGVITDDDPLPRVTVGPDVSIMEGNSGVSYAVVTATLTGETLVPISVTSKTSDGTATFVPGADYTQDTTVVTFQPGETVKTVEIPILGDVTVEPTEYFWVRFTGPAGVLVNDTVKVTIIDDDTTEWVVTSLADFSGGTPDVGAYLSPTGEIILAPAVGGELVGTSLPAGWTSTPLAVGGATAATIDGALVDGAALIATGPAQTAGRSIEFTAVLAPGAAGQYAGLSSTGGLTAPYALFGTSVANALVARTVGGTTLETPITTGANWFTKSHKFRIDWNATKIVYWIDDKKVATHTIALTQAMQPVAIDSTVGDGALKVTYMRMTPYAPAGNYTSAVFDAGSVVTWNTIFWNSATPAGTGLVISYRTGDTPVPDDTWTTFTTIPWSGVALSGSSRYFQFAVQATTTDPGQTPTLRDVTLEFDR